MFDMPRVFNPVAGTGGVEQLPLTSPLDFGTDENPINAFLYYSVLGALDPKNPFVEARGLAASTGLAYWPALAVVMLTGGIVLGAVGTILDPKHKMKGGLDDTPFGAKVYGRRTFDRSSTIRTMSQYITGAPQLKYEAPTYSYDPYYS